MNQLPMQSAALLGALALTGCASIGGIPTTRAGSAVLVSANGLPAGTASIGAAGDRLTLTVAVGGLPEGIHGIHLHTTGRCDASGFTSAGGHLNPAGHQHGSLNPNGSHLGDLPNLAVGGNGAGAITATLSGTRAELERALFDVDGTAIVIHASADDYRTDPSGNSGARIACGVLIRNP
ncbi:MAG TPA: superoxide dismutase family protein [Novosphingobium sp.]|nr:superoxide dismutase family protein [Novosphingobium sp.]